MAKNEKVERPTKKSEYELRFASVQAKRGWTDLKATIMHSRGILFTWSDRSCDEEGYLLEVKPQGSQEFEVAAVLDPNINSFGLITLPNEKRASFRVRAFYYGKPSNLVHEITGPDRQRS